MPYKYASPWRKMGISIRAMLAERPFMLVEHRGIYRNNRVASKPYQVVIRHNKRYHWGGRWPTVEQAIVARDRLLASLSS